MWHIFLIRAICFIGWAILFSRFHACCFWAPSPWGPLCTSEPPASLASKRNRVLHFNTTDYFKIMFPFPRKRLFSPPPFFSLVHYNSETIYPASAQDQEIAQQGVEGTHFRPSVVGKRPVRGGLQGSGRTQTAPQPTWPHALLRPGLWFSYKGRRGQNPSCSHSQCQVQQS